MPDRATPGLPHAGVLPLVVPRRPGERHDVVDLPIEFAAALEAQAAARGLTRDVAATLVIEARSLRFGNRSADQIDAFSALLDAAAEIESRVQNPLSSAEAAYLRTLTMTRTRAPRTEALARVAIPVRLLSRLSTALTQDRPIELQRAMRWEVAALTAAMTMSEWAYSTVVDRLSAQAR